ncbi:MAG: OmpA family protein [Crocinitomicaceae bacterium]|nr:OmpA family protein [Crocinitomicaceae bacterium]
MFVEKLHKIVFLFLISILTFNGFAQIDDEACTPPDKKVVKIIEKAKLSTDPKLAVDGFLQAMDLAPEKAMVYFEYGMYAFNKASEYYNRQPTPNTAAGDKSLQKAEDMLMQAVDLCGYYHADMYYYLGVINYTQQDMASATNWFDKFAKFKSDDPSRYGEDHAKKMADVKEVVGEYKAEADKKAKTVPYNPVMVPNVSSKLDEYFPMISPDNELMFYTRKVNEQALGEMTSYWVEKFTVSKRDKMTLPFDNGTYLKAPFNDGSFDNYGASTLSVDNKEMIVCACKNEVVYEQNYKNCDLYITTYERVGQGVNDFKWSELKNMGPAINTKDGWEGQPSLSADGNTLYFATTRRGSQDNDIYYSTRDADGEWTQAKPVVELNTPGKDKSPFLHQDSETLYFVSDGRKDGMGGLDIYYTRKDEKGKWEEPKNIGYPINTDADEIGIFVSIDGKLAYFSSRQGGNWNIYGFELYEEARPKSVAIIKGELASENGEPIENAVIELAYENSDVVTQVKVNGNDGKYAAIVKTDKPQDVMVTVKKEGSAFDSKLISKEEVKEVVNSKDVAIRGNDLNVKELKVGEAYTINDILYATNSYALTDKSKFILKGFARFLKENPTIKVAIQGHTDDIGDDTKNLVLSDNRARGVREFLISLGIDGKRLKAKGYGETQPKVENSSDENRAKNRRTDFVIESL